jgi:phage terminase large subunit-like protein
MDVTAGEMAYMDRFNRVDYSVLEDRLEATYNRFNLDMMTIEDNSIGQGVIDHLRNRGLAINTFTTTNATKHAAITGLQSAFEHGRIKILNDPVLIGELQAFEAKRNSSGTFSYSAPESMHDDCVMALAIAWQGMENTGGVILFEV